MPAEHQLPLEVEAAGRQGRVVAALGFQRDRIAERRGQRAATRRHRQPRPALASQRRAVARVSRVTPSLRRAELRAPRPCRTAPPRACTRLADRHREVVRVGHGLPLRDEGAGDEARRQARLQRGELGAAHVRGSSMPSRAPASSCAEAPRVPPRSRRVPARRRAHQCLQAGVGDQACHLASRRARISALCAAMLACDLVGPAGAPEAQQPGRDLRQVGGRDGQRPERIAEPARQLAQDARASPAACTSEKAKAPALPRLVSSAMPLRSIRSDVTARLLQLVGRRRCR